MTNAFRRFRKLARRLDEAGEGLACLHIPDPDYETWLLFKPRHKIKDEPWWPHHRHDERILALLFCAEIHR